MHLCRELTHTVWFCQPSSKQEGRNVNFPSASGNAPILSSHNTVVDCWTGDINEAMYKRNSDGGLWKRDGDTRVTSFSRSAGQLDQGQSGSEDTLRTRQNSHIFNFPSVPNAQMTKTHQETSQQNCYLKDNSYDCKPVDISATACRPVGPSGIHVTAGTR